VDWKGKKKDKGGKGGGKRNSVDSASANCLVPIGYGHSNITWKKREKRGGKKKRKKGAPHRLTISLELPPFPHRTRPKPRRKEGERERPVLTFWLPSSNRLTAAWLCA